MSTKTHIPALARMPLWKRLLIANSCGLAGALLAVIGLPEDTPFWVWACSTALCLVVLNWLVYRRKQ